MTIVLGGVLSLLLAVIATATYLPLARRRAWLDTPVERSSHTSATPSSGGLALMVALFGCIAILYLAGQLVPDVAMWQALCAAALLSIMGGLDDRKPLGVRTRLAVQFLAAFWVLGAYGYFTQHWLIAVLFLIGLVWLLNLYNFMDGIDGIAALQCGLTAATLCCLGAMTGAGADFQLFAALLSGTFLGFLAFNWPPARLFMGDAGSLSAGMLLGCLGLWSYAEGWFSPVCWLLPMSPFLLDTGFTLVRRAMRRERLSHGHKSHIYQRLARHWGGHGAVDRALLAVHLCWLLPLTLAAGVELVNPWTLLLVGLFPQLVLMAKWHSLE